MSNGEAGVAPATAGNRQMRRLYCLTLRPVTGSACCTSVAGLATAVRSWPLARIFHQSSCCGRPKARPAGLSLGRSARRTGQVRLRASRSRKPRRPHPGTPSLRTTGEMSGLRTSTSTYPESCRRWPTRRSKTNSSGPCATSASTVILGYDYPQISLADTLDAFERLDLTEEERARIRSGNARRLFGL